MSCRSDVRENPRPELGGVGAWHRRGAWHRTGRTSLLLAVVMAVGLALGCGEAPLPKDGTEVSLLASIPEPALERVDGEVAEQLRQVRRETDEALREPNGGAEARGGALGRLGQHYHAYQLTDLAAAAYDAAWDLDGGDPRWPYLAGTLAMEEGEVGRAREAFEASLEILTAENGGLDEGRTVGDARVAASLALARAEIEAGEEAAAKDRLRALVERYPGAAPAHFELGRLAAVAGQGAAAVEHFQATLSLAPEADAVRLPLAQAYRGLGREAEARAQLERRGPGRLREADPFLAPVQALATGAASHLTRAGRAWRQGLMDEALAEYAAAVAAAPDHLGARRDYAFALAEAGRPEDAAVQLREALERDPGSPLLHHGLGLMLARSGDLEGAAAAQRRALKRDPRFVDAHFELGLALARGGRPDAAVESFAAVLKLDPQQSRARLNQGTALLALGRGEEALEAFRQVDRSQPSPRARLGEAQALASLGRWRAARALLEDKEPGRAAVGESGDGARALTRLLALAPPPVGDAAAARRRAEAAFQSEAGPAQARSLALALAASGDTAAAADLQLQLFTALTSGSTAPGDAFEPLRQEAAAYEAGRRCCAGATAADLAARAFAPL